MQNISEKRSPGNNVSDLKKAAAQIADVIRQHHSPSKDQMNWLAETVEEWVFNRRESFINEVINECAGDDIAAAVIAEAINYASENPILYPPGGADRRRGKLFIIPFSIEKKRLPVNAGIPVEACELIVDSVKTQGWLKNCERIILSEDIYTLEQLSSKSASGIIDIAFSLFKSASVSGKSYSDNDYAMRERSEMLDVNGLTVRYIVGLAVSKNERDVTLPFDPCTVRKPIVEEKLAKKHTSFDAALKHNVFSKMPYNPTNIGLPVGICTAYSIGSIIANGSVFELLLSDAIDEARSDDSTLKVFLTTHVVTKQDLAAYAEGNPAKGEPYDHVRANIVFYSNDSNDVSSGEYWGAYHWPIYTCDDEKTVAYYYKKLMAECGIPTHRVSGRYNFNATLKVGLSE